MFCYHSHRRHPNPSGYRSPIRYVPGLAAALSMTAASVMVAGVAVAEPAGEGGRTAEASVAAVRTAAPTSDVMMQINGTPIPRSRFIDELNEAYGESYRETFISHVLVEERARQAGLTVTTEEIEAYVRENLDALLEARFEANNPFFSTDPRERERTIKSWEKRLRLDGRYDLLAEQLVKKDRTVSEDALRQAFEEKYGPNGVQIRARHIQRNVSVAGSPDYTLERYTKETSVIDAETKARAEEALRKLRASEMFEKVMNAYSDDPRRVAGGTLGNSRGRFGSEFDEAVGALKEGELSGLLRWNDGYRIVQCTALNDVEELRARQILLATGARAKGRSNEESQKKAEEVLAQIRAGGDFEKLARENSDDAVSAPQGGDMGWFARRAMVKAFEDAAFALGPGQVSDIVRTGFGFHIVKTLEKRTSQERKLRQIFVSNEFPNVKERRLRPMLEAKARAQLEVLAADLRKPGVSFGDLAKKHSDDPSTKDDGGYLRPFREGVYKGEFDEAVLAMKGSDPPRIVKDASGNLHLLLVEGTVTTDFEKVRDSLRAEILGRPVGGREKTDYLRKLRQEATVTG